MTDVQSAEQGDAEAQFQLGVMHGCGFGGFKQDDPESAKWLRLAGEQGDGKAQARLGDLYAAGEGGVRRDPVEADRWYRLATRTDVEVTVMAGQEFTSGRECTRRSESEPFAG